MFTLLYILPALLKGGHVEKSDHKLNKSYWGLLPKPLIINVETLKSEEGKNFK